MTDLTAIGKTLSHPLRVAALVLLDQVARDQDNQDGRLPGLRSPNELADHFAEPLGNVSYHVRELEGAGLVELKKTEPRRGALAHYYEITADGQRVAALIRDLVPEAAQ